MFYYGYFILHNKKYPKKTGPRMRKQMSKYTLFIGVCIEQTQTTCLMQGG